MNLRVSKIIAASFAFSMGFMLLSEPVFAQSNRLSTGQSASKQTCKGSGANKQCLFCVTTDGAKSCGWVKVSGKK